MKERASWRILHWLSSKYSVSWQSRMKNVQQFHVNLFVVSYSFCACGKHQADPTMQLSSCHPLTFLISCSAGKPCCLCDCGIWHSIKTSVGLKLFFFKLLICMFSWLFSWHVKSAVEIPAKKQKSFGPFTPLFFSFLVFFFLAWALFQPLLFLYQIPFLHNYHLLILNESPNTLHGFNTAC